MCYIANIIFFTRNLLGFKINDYFLTTRYLNGGYKLSFLESYKHLKKICGDIMNDERRLSAYIDAMAQKSNGSFYVRGWDYDLKQLKHYRWVRNQITHEPGCTEQNMCNPNDAIWFDDFYARIMNQTDPLALYHQATKSRPVQHSSKVKKQSQINCDSTNKMDKYSYKHNKDVSCNFMGCFALIVCILFIIVMLLYY